MRFGSEDRLSRVQNLLSTELDQETVLMSIDPIFVDRLVEEYQVSPETCAADLERFLEEIEREGLLCVE
jgi:hypothetical protein